VISNVTSGDAAARARASAPAGKNGSSVLLMHSVGTAMPGR
jgi:hypothetical protein